MSDSADVRFLRQSADVDRGSLRQMRFEAVDVSAAFKDQAPREVDCTGLQLLTNWINPDGTAFISPSDCRIYVKFNHPENPWLPFSLVPNVGDFVSAAGTIKRVWFWCRFPTGSGSVKLGVLYLYSFGVLSGGATPAAGGTSSGAGSLFNGGGGS